MAERALIIAVEKYDQITDGSVEKKLDGTLAAAQRFRDWLEAKWQAERTSGQILFCSNPPVPGGQGASKDDIIRALRLLLKEGRDQTDVFYFYFSGHGFRLPKEPAKLADVLVAAEFEDVIQSGASCFKLDALIAGLRSSLGIGCHYYFVDACRNEVKKAIGSDIMPFPEDGTQDPSVFVLQSTLPGAPSLVGGPFATKLLEGLRGEDIAKAWRPPHTDFMQVSFESLNKFLRSQLQNTQPIAQSTDGEIGVTEAVLATIRPVPQVTLKIAVQGSFPGVSGTVTITSFGSSSGAVHDLTESLSTFVLVPNHYRIKVSFGSFEVTPAEVDVQLYSDHNLQFSIAKQPSVVSEGATRGLEDIDDNIHIQVPTGRSVVMRHLGTGAEAIFFDSKKAFLPEGNYSTILRSLDGTVLETRDIYVETGRIAKVTPAAWRDSLPHQSIAERLPNHDGGVDFSESLGGPVTDPDLGIWLAILGGARVMQGDSGFTDYTKIKPLPLAEFSAEHPGSSPIYLLAGVPYSDLNLDFGLSTAGGESQWVKTRQADGMRGLREAVVHPPAGQYFLTFAVGNQPTYTIASFASPNRCTLIVLTLDEDGSAIIGQYLLPLGSLLGYLNPKVQERMQDRWRYKSPLEDVRTLALLSRAFRRRRRIEREFGNDKLGELLYAKWLDPIGASLATYESVRRGEKQYLAEVAQNMELFFPDLPDTMAIRRLAGHLEQRPRGVPLFADGLRAFGPDKSWLPYEPASLDWSGQWTAWRSILTRPRRL
jgi:Caspase domain